MKTGESRAPKTCLSVSQFCLQLAVTGLYILVLYKLILNLPKVVLHIENFIITCEYFYIYSGVFLFSYVLSLMQFSDLSPNFSRLKYFYGYYYHREKKELPDFALFNQGFSVLDAI